MSKKTKDWKNFKESHEKEEIEAEPLLDEEDEALEEGGNSHYTHKIKELEATIEKLTQESDEKCLRLKAEMKNAEHRAFMDAENTIKRSVTKICEGLIPAVDALENALNHAQAAEDQAMIEGLELTLKLLLDALNKQGVNVINPLGEPFNPQEHEAMSMQQDPSQAPDTVLIVFQKGYKLQDRIIRPARVIINKSL